VVEHSQALASGLYASFYYVGGCMGSVIPSYLWDLGGWNACVWLIAGVQMLSATSAFVFWIRRQPPRSSAEDIGPLGV